MGWNKSEDDVPKYQLSTTYDEENDKIKYPIEVAKPSPCAAAPIETALSSPISTVPIVATRELVFLSAKVPDRLLSLSVPMQPSPVTTYYITLELILIVYNLTRLCVVNIHI